MADRSMSYQRACRETQAAVRELEDWHREPGQGTVVGNVGGYMVVEQPDGSYTVQHGLRVLGAGLGWSREQAEAEAQTRAASVTGIQRGQPRAATGEPDGPELG